MGAGITPPTEDRDNMKRVANWLRQLPAPRYPFKIDDKLAASGAPVYKQYCAACHGTNGKDFTGQYVGKVTPIEHIRTDRHRLDSYTYDVAVNQNMIFAGYGEERLQPFPQNLRLCEQSPRRIMVARTVSAQWFGSDSPRSARAGRPAAQDFLPWLRRL